MSFPSHRIFISYRREDAAGYAGRLEEALERRLGRGSVFRDVLDIAPGDDFVQAIRSRLAGAGAVLVLIGPRWAGEGPAGQRRIDRPDDFVRLEVATGLESGARVVPVLLPGATMPAEPDLPAPLRPLARRHAMSLGDAHWEADLDRLVAALGLPGRRRLWPWALGALVLAAGVSAGLSVWQRGAGQEPAADPLARWVGAWQAQVTYGWGDSYSERFDFTRHAGQLTGTASFLAHPRGIEDVQSDGSHLRFVTRSRQSMGNETREVTHFYSVELRGTAPAQTLSVRMQTRGAFDEQPPLQFEARRVAAAAPVP